MELPKNDAEKVTIKFTLENSFHFNQVFNEISHGICLILNSKLARIKKELKDS